MLRIVLLAVVCLVTLGAVAQAIPGLMIPEERMNGQCIQDGQTVTYECTVDDPLGTGLTVWLGSAFNCPSSMPTENNQIELRHSVFTPAPGVMGNCGDLSAMSIGVNGTEYTSSLTLMATLDLDGTMINCTISDVIFIGSDIVRVGAPPSQPQPVVDVTSTSSLTVNWDSVSDVAMYRFTVTGGDCGDCMGSIQVSGTSMTCSGLTRGQTCSFEVRAISADCGFESQPARGSVSLEGPSTPSDLDLQRNYTCSFDTSSFNLTWNPPENLNADVPPVTGYHVRVMDGSNVIFDNATDSQERNINIPGSIFPRANSYIFTVAAFNPIDESQATMTTFDVAATNVSSTSTPSMTSTNLEFTLNPLCLQESADITVYYAECEPLTSSCQCPQDDSITAKSTNSMPVTANPFNITLDSLLSGGYYCYRSVVRNGVLVGFENGRMFVTVRPPPNETFPGAVLVDIETATYQCVNSAEGFNGGSSQTVADFNPRTGLFSVPQCSLFGWLIAVIIILILIIAISVVVAVVITIICCLKKGKGKEDKEKLRDPERKSPSPENPALYADPNTIERQVAPGTTDEYSMVDVKNKKNKNPKPTQPEALYQDPNSIEHEIGPSGDTYAVVDKSKRGSSKKKEPDVVPGPSDGLTYADIDVAGNRHRPNPASQRQAQQPVGSVEYSDVKFKEEAQL